MLTMVAVLAACGGSGGGSNAPADNNTETPNNPDDGGNNPGNPDDGGDNPGNPDDGDNPGTPDDGGLTDEEEAKVLTLVDTKNQFTLSVCPETIGMAGENVPLGELINSLACENEALTNISLGNDNVLGLLCPETVAATDTDLIGSATDVAFLPGCLTESAAFLKDNITGLLDGTSPLLQDGLCPEAGDAVSCLVNVLEKTPSTVQATLGLLGCEDMMNPQVCLMGVANNLQSGELLIGTVNTLTNAVCPLTSTNGFDPQACLTEAIQGVGSVLNLSGGLAEICEDGANPLSCLSDAGALLGPVTDVLGGVPVVGDLVNGLIGGLGDPGNLDLLETLPELLAGIPVLGDLIGDQIGGGEGGADALFSLLEQLQGLPELASQIPVLGDLLNGIAGGDGGGLPLDVLDLESLLGGLSGGQLDQVTELLNQVPLLGPLVDQLLGAVSCESDNPLECLTSASDQLGQFTDLLAQVPVLGDLLNPLLGTLLGAVDGGGLDGDPLATLTGALEQIPVAGDLLNQVLGTLLGAAEGGDPGDLLNPATDLLTQVPVLGDLVDSLLGGLMAGDTDLDGLLGGVIGANGALVPALSDLLGQVPALGEPLVQVVDVLAGDNDSLLKQLLSPLEDVLSGIPGLGDLLGGLLGGLFGWT
jgi:hypothetical protein